VKTNKHAEDKSASKTSTRGLIATCRPHSSLDRWGKAVALGAAGGAASYGAKKGLEAAFRKKRR